MRFAFTTIGSYIYLVSFKLSYYNEYKSYFRHGYVAWHDAVRVKPAGFLGCESCSSCLLNSTSSHPSFTRYSSCSGCEIWNCFVGCPCCWITRYQYLIKVCHPPSTTSNIPRVTWLFVHRSVATHEECCLKSYLRC